jgi:hypothetical protein
MRVIKSADATLLVGVCETCSMRFRAHIYLPNYATQAEIERSRFSKNLSTTSASVESPTNRACQNRNGSVLSSHKYACSPSHVFCLTSNMYLEVTTTSSIRLTKPGAQCDGSSPVKVLHFVFYIPCLMDLNPETTTIMHESI